MVNLNLSGKLLLLVLITVMSGSSTTAEAVAEHRNRNAYATMMYMGTPRDYEFYIAIRVMFRSLRELRIDADLVVIASMDVPLHWLQSLENEDGAKIIRVENIKNPYHPNLRFKSTLNKLYAWKLTQYDRVVMLDADNLFLHKTDELFQCGHFCAVFINPCIFHTGLFVLKPSMEVFNDMIHEIEIGRRNPDGADQGFITGYFPDLLDSPMFHPPPINGTKLQGIYRLPLGYQMDATYYYLRLRWNVPCGPNSVITFPGAPLLKPWYWWSWPLLPLGIDWHTQRFRTLGYAAEMPAVLLQGIFHLGVIAVVSVLSPNFAKFWTRYEGKMSFKWMAMTFFFCAYLLPLWTIPSTIHPVMGWGLYLLGTSSISLVVATSFLLPLLSVLTPGIAIFGALVTMAYPWYSNGVERALWIFGYGFCSAPFMWVACTRIMSSLHRGRAKSRRPST